MKRTRYLFGFLVMLCFALNIKAQTFIAGASIDSTEILIGDQVNFKWEITAPKESKIILPEFQDTIIEEIEIIEKGKLDSLIKGEKLTLSQSMLITSFDSGYYRIPPYEFKVLSGEDTLTASTNELFLYVNTLDVDTTQAIKDIKEPISEPITFKEILPWVLGGVGLVAIILTTIFIIRRLRKSKPILMKPKPKIPPHVIALKELDHLKDKKLWQSNQEKLYHSELTEIVRKYIDERFQINAMEMTTDEIMEQLQSKVAEESLKNKLNQMLTLADLVKFAKAHPLPTEHDQSIKNAYDFVEHTKQEIKEEHKNNGVHPENQELPPEKSDNYSQEENKSTE